jgi:capsular polysaccharide biosynthesis protein
MSTPITDTADTSEPRQRQQPWRDHLSNGGAPPAGRRSPSFATSVRRHPLVVILPAVLLLVVGIVVGAKTSPTYSAGATVNVGKSDINTQATPGYVQAAQALASTYSRVAMSQHVAIPVARQLNQSPAAVGGHITAVPIPNSPTFTITATGSSPQAAVTLANASVKALLTYVNQTATQQGGSTQLISQYQAAETKSDRLALTAGNLQARLRLHRHGVTASQVTAAKVASQVAALKAQSLSGAYLNLGTNGSAPSLDVLQNPTSATSSNRKTNIEKYGIVGLVAGLAIGIAFAVLLGAMQAMPRARRASA